MKKLMIVIVFLMSGIGFISCKKCVTCTESGTQTKSSYCGTPIDVKAFEDNLKTQGANYGQYWSCVNQ
jgi:hypothetical protein